MAQQQGMAPLTDDELKWVAENQPELVNQLNSEERRRLSGLAPQSPKAQPERTWTDTAVDALPAVGGAIGGIVGGIGGTAFGLGIGGVPGAVGGAALGGATGESARQLVNRYRGESAPATPLEAASSIAKEGTTQAALEATGQAVPRVLGATGRAVYRGYLKPSLAKNQLSKADQIVETAIQEALPVTAGGAKQADRLIGELRGAVDTVLAANPGKVDLHQVAERVRSYARSKYYRPGVPTADFNTAMAVADRIDAHPSLGLPPGARPTRVEVPVAAANEVKRGVDTSVGEAAFGAKSGAEKSTEKFARRALRKDIEAQVPEVGPKNAREGRLIDVAKAINRAVGREGNKNAVSGVTSLMAGGYGASDYYRNGDPYAAAAKALALKAALDPAVATRAAIVAARLGGMSGSAPATIAKAAVAAVSEAQRGSGEVPSEVGQQEQ